MTDVLKIAPPKGASARADVFYIALLVALWVTMAIAVNPVGSFPLNDDWAYGKSVQHLLATGRFSLHDWGAMNLIPQIYWGALFCLPFGFSFTALRFSTLTLGLAGVLAVYALLREFHPRPPIPILGALLIALNPIYLGLSNTFMTDVPFFTLFVLSIWTFSRGLRRNSKGLLLAGIVVAGLALLIRQFGLVLFISFGCAYIFKRGAALKNIVVGSLVAVAGVALQISYQHWLQTTGRLPIFFGNVVGNVEKILSADLGIMLLESLQRILEFAIYSGMFLFPLLLLLYVRQFRSWTARRRRWMGILLVSFFAVTLVAFILPDRWMPFMPNVMSDLGLGPLTLRDASFGVTIFARPPVLAVLWILLTASGVLGAGFLFGCLFLGGNRILRKRGTVPVREKWPVALVLTAMILYFSSLLTQGVFDRYLLPFLPLFLMLAGAVTADGLASLRISRTLMAVLLLLLGLYGGFAVGATHDYLLWNRVRWEASRALKENFGITPREIDGGYEFNGWYQYRRGYRSRPGISWWWVDDDEYSIVFGPVPGYEILKTYPLKRWLPFGPKAILLIRKDARPPGLEP